MSFDAHKNFAYARVATPPTPALSGATVVLGAGQGALMPTPPFNATVWPYGAQPGQPVGTVNMEIIRVTARPGNADTFTILRAQEGTTARAIVVGDQIAETITAKTLTDVESAVTQEITDRAAADTAEASTRAAADTAEASARAAAITSEASTRATADTNEASTRASADTTEATARAAADALLTPLTSPRLPPIPTASGRWLHDKAGGLVYESPSLSDLAQSGATDKQVVQWSTGSGAFVALLLTDANVASANKDGTAGTASMRTLGTGAQQAAAGNDARLSDARTPTTHASTHLPAAGDPLDWSGHVFQAGTHAARPAASTAYASLWYFETDKLKFYQCAADGSAWQQRTSGRVLYHVDDYGATTNDTDPAGVTSAAFTSAKADAESAGGGDVLMGAGTYRVTQANGQGGLLNATANMTGLVRFRGAGGFGTTTVHLVSPVSSFMTFNATDASHPEIRNYEFWDFTLDGNGSATTNKGYLVHYSQIAGGNYYDVGYHRYTRVDSRNFGHAGAAVRTFIRYIANRQSIAEAASAGTIYYRNTYITDCYAGWSKTGDSTSLRGGGTAGVILSGFLQTASSDKDANGRIKPSSAAASANPANVWVDQCYIDNFEYDSGEIPTSGQGGVAFGGAPILLGGDGGALHARIRGGCLRGSSDVTIEIDNGVDVVIDGVESRNNANNAFLVFPYGAAAGTQSSHVIMRNCTATWEATNPFTGAAITDWAPGGFVLNTRFGAVSHGHYTFENCTTRMEGGWALAWTAYSIGPARVVTVKNCKSIVTGNVVAGGGAKSLNHMKVFAVGRKMELNLHDFSAIVDGTVDNTALINKVVTVVGASNLTLNVDGVSARQKLTRINGGTVDLKLWDITSLAQTVTDNFSQDLLGADVVYDLGAATDYTYQTSDYTASANLGAVKRGYHLATNTDTQPTNHIGLEMNGGQSWKATIGASLTGYQAGCIARRISSTSYLLAYVYDDGTHSYLCLDKVSGGNPVSLLGSVGATAAGANGSGGSMTVTAFTPAVDTNSVTYTSDRGIQLATRLTTSLVHWPRIVVLGDTVYAEHFVTAAPGNAITRPDTAGAWVSATLAGSDQTTWGSIGRMGYFGYQHVPKDAAARLDDFVHNRLHVVTGTIRGLHPLGDDTDTAEGFGYQPSFIGHLSVNGKLRVEGNFRDLGPGTSTIKDTDLLTTDLEFMARLSVDRSTWWTKPAPVVTVLGASPATHRNVAGMPVISTISGSAISKIELSTDEGTTFTEMIGGAGVPRAAGDQLRVTGTGTMTLTDIPMAR